MRIWSIFVFMHLFVVFCFQLLLGAFLKAGINEFEISIKFCIFLYPYWYFWRKKIFWVIIALFAFFKCKCEKKYIFKHFAKSKKLFFCHYLSFSVWFILKFQKSIKLKPPNVRELYSCSTKHPLKVRKPDITAWFLLKGLDYGLADFFSSNVILWQPKGRKYSMRAVIPRTRESDWFMCIRRLNSLNLFQKITIRYKY